MRRVGVLRIAPRGAANCLAALACPAAGRRFSYGARIRIITALPGPSRLRGL